MDARCVYLFVFFALFSVVFGGYQNKIKLKDVESLTLYQNRKTSYRRTSPLPQLRCVGGSAGCHQFVPQVVQCQNKGSDEFDVQWECKAEMDKRFRFGHIQVNCEGFDYPDDPYILKGSCGLEYTIDFAHGSNAQSTFYDNGYSYYQTNVKQSKLSNMVAIAIIALVAYGIYRSCNTRSRDYGTTPDDNDGSFGRGTFGGGSYPNAPPPPGFRPDFQPGSGGCSGSGTSSQNNNGGYGGFLSGAAAGGLLGYLFGSRNSDQTYRRPNYYRSSSPGSGSTWGRSNDGGNSSETRTTSGFGGTTRR